MFICFFYLIVCYDGGRFFRLVWIFMLLKDMRRNWFCLLVFYYFCKEICIEYFRWLFFYECFIFKIDKCFKFNILFRFGLKWF